MDDMMAITENTIWVGKLNASKSSSVPKLGIIDSESTIVSSLIFLIDYKYLICILYYYHNPQISHYKLINCLSAQMLYLLELVLNSADICY